MRTIGLLLAIAVAAQAGDPVPDEEAQAALVAFKEAYKSKSLEERQNAVYNLHDYPNDLVLKQLEKLLKTKDPAIRNVAALALGGQNHNRELAGKILLKAYRRDFKQEEVVSSTLEAITELEFLHYWPEFKRALKDERSSVVIRILDMLGNNRDWRALPELLAMYQVVMPKRATWKTGTVNVDTGAAGDADAKAAEAKFNAKYGSGGSKEKSKAKRKANSFDLRNFSTQLRKCVQKITGQEFDNAFDLEEWIVENYVEVAKKAAELDGKDPESVVARATKEQKQRRAALEEERRKMEEELAKQRGS